jgi:hypothetical protein
MADSTTNLDTISTSQSQKEVTANDLFDAGSSATSLGRRASTTAALTWGYYGGIVTLDSGSLAQVANGTKTLTDAATNYIELDTSDGSIDLNTSAWTGTGKKRLYKVITAGGVVTSYEDWRPGGVGSSPSVAAGDVAGPGSATDNYLALFDGTTGKLIKVGNAQAVVGAGFYPGVPSASVLCFLVAAPSGIATVTYAAAMAGSSGKALVAATAQTDFDVRKNATTAANGTSVGTIRFAAAGTVPTFIAASPFSLTGGTDWLTVWAPATPDATLADIGFSLYATR